MVNTSFTAARDSTTLVFSTISFVRSSVASEGAARRINSLILFEEERAEVDKRPPRGDQHRQEGDHGARRVPWSESPGSLSIGEPGKATIEPAEEALLSA